MSEDIRNLLKKQEKDEAFGIMALLSRDPVLQKIAESSAKSTEYKLEQLREDLEKTKSREHDFAKLAQTHEQDLAKLAQANKYSVLDREDRQEHDLALEEQKNKYKLMKDKIKEAEKLEKDSVGLVKKTTKAWQDFSAMSEEVQITNQLVDLFSDVYDFNTGKLKEGADPDNLEAVGYWENDAIAFSAKHLRGIGLSEKQKRASALIATLFQKKKKIISGTGVSKEEMKQIWESQGYTDYDRLEALMKYSRQVLSVANSSLTADKRVREAVIPLIQKDHPGIRFEGGSLTYNKQELKSRRFRDG